MDKVQVNMTVYPPAEGQTLEPFDMNKVIAFRLFAAQSLDLDDDVKFYGKANMHTIGKILNGRGIRPPTRLTP